MPTGHTPPSPTLDVGQSIWRRPPYEQFDAIHQALPDAATRLLVETAIESGLRWGELAELRAGDLDLTTRILTVSRTVVELDPKFHPEGGRFLVKP